jgi:hypothetical protein
MRIGDAASMRAVGDGAPGQRMPGGKRGAIDAGDQWLGHGLREAGFRWNAERTGTLNDGAASDVKVAGNFGPGRAVATHLKENGVGKGGPSDGLCHKGELMMSENVSMSNVVRQTFLFRNPAG